MWQDESEKRPSFAEIVQTLQSNVKNATSTSEESCTELEDDVNERNNYTDILPP